MCLVPQLSLVSLLLLLFLFFLNYLRSEVYIGEREAWYVGGAFSHFGITMFSMCVERGNMLVWVAGLSHSAWTGMCVCVWCSAFFTSRRSCVALQLIWRDKLDTAPAHPLLLIPSLAALFLCLASQQLPLAATSWRAVKETRTMLRWEFLPSHTIKCLVFTVHETEISMFW